VFMAFTSAYIVRSGLSDDWRSIEFPPLLWWNTAVLITNAANATLFGNTAPLWVGLGALLVFKEKLRPALWAGMLLAMCGAALILGGDFLTHPRLGLGAHYRTLS